MTEKIDNEEDEDESEALDCWMYFFKTKCRYRASDSLDLQGIRGKFMSPSI